ncbi:hypothetical protein JM79_1748 [Gramella sp. Hel_I_59]|uniref:hypothetical protein n=1 Tax=Gramella sp. Hel_I_59 TaxID=1249978 RepID=UPI0011500B4D|nr:hypothetical protein [Gramella sp. Hel_I_59]TQI70823.1 hypothetical protein JM79_1748 [Gramella sp. Hel_I_59]
MKKVKTESSSSKLVQSDKKDLPYNPEITKEDKEALNEKGRSMNKGQDKDLDKKEHVDFTPDELDIPASNDTKLEDKTELVDEENMQFNKKGAKGENEKSGENLSSSN